MAATAPLTRRAATILGASTVAATAVYCGHSRYQATRAIGLGDGLETKFPIASPVEATMKSPWSKLGFTSIILEEAHIVNHNVKQLRFKLPEGYTDSAISPITSMLSIHVPEGSWLPVVRPYTPIDHAEPGHLSFLVKKYPNGKGSGHLHSLKPGDSLKVKPIHEFDYKPSEQSHLTILAGGAGITPFIQLLRAVLRDTSSSTKISLVYANNTIEDILARDELDKLAAEQSERFRAVYVVSKPAAGDAKVVPGRISKEIVEQALPADRREWPATTVLVCGPDPMTAAVAGAKGVGFSQGSLGGILKELGLQKAQVHKF